MDTSTRLIEHQGFPAFWNKLFRIVVRWLCLYLGIAVACYEAYYWLRFAEILDLDTYKILPPRLLGYLYNLSNWEGVNVIFYNFLKLPVFITVPLINFIVIFAFFQSTLGIYYLIGDSRLLIKKIAAIGSRKRN